MAQASPPRSDTGPPASERPGGLERLAGRAPGLPLALLLLALPAFRQLTPLFDWTSGERLAVGLLELAFVASCLAGRALGWPLPLADAWRRAPVWSRGVGLAWVAWSTLAASLSEWPEAAWLRQAEWLGHALFAWVLWAWLAAVPARRRPVALGLPAGFALWLAWLGIFAWTRADPTTYDWVNEPPGFHNIRHADYYACAALLALAALRPERRMPVFLLASLVPFWTFAIWTGSRGVLLAIAVACAAIGLARLARGGWAVRCAWLAATALLGAGLSRLLRVESDFLGLEYVVGRSLGGLTTRGGVAEKLSETTAGRWDSWARLGLEVWEHPWLGLGPDGFSFLPESSVQPHNLVLQSTLEWGLPGALLFGALGAALLAGAWRLVRRHGTPAAAPRLAGLAPVLGLTAYSAVDGTLYSAFPLTLAAVGTALALQPGDAPQDPGPGGGRSRFVAPAVASGTALLVAGVLGLHAAVVLALAREPAPAPGEPAARLVRAFPTRVESALHVGGVLFWAIEWSERDPETAIEWLHWSHGLARRPWPHYQMEARLLWQAGRRREALEHVEIAARMAALPGQLLQSRALERAMKGR